VWCFLWVLRRGREGASQEQVAALFHLLPGPRPLSIPEPCLPLRGRATKSVNPILATCSLDSKFRKAQPSRYPCKDKHFASVQRWLRGHLIVGVRVHENGGGIVIGAGQTI
jgi:hypothetical protein